jgi:hypothetical protein
MSPASKISMPDFVFWVVGLQRMPEKEMTTQYFLREWFMERSLNRRLNGDNKQVERRDGTEGECK